ncbi:MAG: type II toxin-antitoxin system VapC family toxin [Holophaga sp.]|nr:type II toxin-antitoxin system VapC family toxin [Holophaga sp.]
MNVPSRPRYLLDINIVLDYLMQRQPWYPLAKGLFVAESQEKAELFISANTVATIHFLIRKRDSRKKALAKIEILLQRLRLADVTAAVIARALRMGLDDLEDGIQAGAAIEAGIPVLVTRNLKDFGRIEDLQVHPPEIALAALTITGPAPRR